MLGWDSNPGLQDDRHQRIHATIAMDELCLLFNATYKLITENVARDGNRMSELLARVLLVQVTAIFLNSFHCKNSKERQKNFKIAEKVPNPFILSDS